MIPLQFRRWVEQVISSLGLSPAGAINQYAGAVAPNGWLMCDGSAVSRSAYAQLFNVLGVTYGAGDSATTFNLPDMRGIFPIGAGTTNRAAGKDAAGNYYASILGTYYQDKMQGHKHGPAGTDGTSYYAGVPSGGDLITSGATYRFNFGAGYANTGVPVTDGTNGTPRTAPASWPQSLGLNYIIKT